MKQSKIDNFFTIFILLILKIILYQLVINKIMLKIIPQMFGKLATHIVIAIVEILITF